MGRSIAFMERRLNRGAHRVAKGAFTAVSLIVLTFVAAWCAVRLLDHWMIAEMAVGIVTVFCCLAGTTLVREVAGVFKALERSVATAALETLAENLSDGVVAPLLWYVALGVPGMLAYKMVNTLDSMIAYRSECFIEFGRWAARIDDVANWIPARLTAFLIILAAGRPGLWRFVMRFGRCHASPNSGWPEAAMAGVLGCRFGGTHDYFGEAVYKPYIGTDPRPITRGDAEKAMKVARRAELLAVVLAALTITAISAAVR